MPFAERLACWAVTSPGIESLAAAELQAIGIAPGAMEPGGVEFSATREQLADALLWLRTANRITVRIGTFRAAAFGELERHAAKVAWGDVVPSGATVHFRVTSKKSRLYHQDGIAERLERSVIAAVPGVQAVRAPSAAEALEEDVTRVSGLPFCIVSPARVPGRGHAVGRRLPGALLHLRGWRQAVAKAPLRETLGAALLIASGWEPGLPLVDPFCGSGTIAIEAALMARRLAPGRGRKFAAESWPAVGAGVMPAARVRATALARPGADASIEGFDRDAGAVAASIANAERAGVAGDVAFAQATISDLGADDGAGCVVTNPPYGARIGDRSALRNLYATLGRVLRARRPEWRLTMLSEDRMLEGQTGMRLEEILRTTNGGIPVRVVRSTS